jgi:Flp pilus assembly pilin Flp
MPNSRQRRAQGLVEYALILALVVVIVVTALTALGGVTRDTLLGNVNNMWTNAT